jgi:hypothetical protein
VLCERHLSQGPAASIRLAVCMDQVMLVNSHRDHLGRVVFDPEALVDTISAIIESAAPAAPGASSPAAARFGVWPAAPSPRQADRPSSASHLSEHLPHMGL